MLMLSQIALNELRNMLIIFLQMNNYKAGALEIWSFNWQQIASNGCNNQDNVDIREALSNSSLILCV